MEKAVSFLALTSPRHAENLTQVHPSVAAVVRWKQVGIGPRDLRQYELFAIESHPIHIDDLRRNLAHT